MHNKLDRILECPMKPQNAPITDTDVEIDDLPNQSCGSDMAWSRGRAAIFRQGETLNDSVEVSISTSILHSDPYSSVVL